MKGKYDFIINDLFNVNVQGDEINYSVYTQEKHERRERLFEKMLKSYYLEDYEKVKIVESLLFLSMTPLHSDHPERQKYMLSYGIKQFNDLVIEGKK